MDLDIKSYIDKYVEAETASEDSDLSSRSNASNGTTEVFHNHNNNNDNNNIVIRDKKKKIFLNCFVNVF